MGTRNSRPQHVCVKGIMSRYSAGSMPQDLQAELLTPHGESPLNPSPIYGPKISRFPLSGDDVSIIPEQEHARMVAGWQRWRTTLAEAMDAVHDALEERNYERANEVMLAITQHQAQMSVSMTNVLVRNGIIKGVSDDD